MLRPIKIHNWIEKSSFKCFAHIPDQVQIKPNYKYEIRNVMKVKRIRNTIHVASNPNPCPGSNKAEIEIETFAFCATLCPAHIPDLIQTKSNAETLLSCVYLLLIFFYFNSK